MISESAPSDGFTVDGLLVDAVFARRQRDQASADLLHIAATWVDLHPALDPDWVAYVTCRGQETDLPLAGDETPSVDVRCIPELGDLARGFQETLDFDPALVEPCRPFVP